MDSEWTSLSCVSMMTNQKITRTSDGIPQYDGSPELLPLYREEALQYWMSFEHHKRYLAGPRLVKELSGVAKVAIRTQTLGACISCWGTWSKPCRNRVSLRLAVLS